MVIRYFTEIRERERRMDIGELEFEFTYDNSREIGKIILLLSQYL